MKIAVSGSSGLVGAHLASQFESQGHQVLRVVRRQSAEPNEVWWDVGGNRLDAAKLTGVDAVVHLAGESIASGTWTADRKRRIRDSRVAGTRLISFELSRMEAKPAVFISASAVGYYGDRGDELLNEDSPHGTGFLAELCQEWETATQAARDAGIRTVNLRIGVVLSRSGGALAKMLPVFAMGGGGRIGTGNQYMSWISLADLVGAIEHIIASYSIKGPVNAVAPNPVTNSEFTAVLGKVLHRPTILPVPAFAIKMLLGEMASELLLASQRVQPERLLAAGYVFQHTNLTAALEQAVSGSF